MTNVVVWDGFDIVCLIVVAILLVFAGLVWVFTTIQDKIDEYFERKNKNDFKENRQ